MKRILITFCILLAAIGCSPVINCDQPQGAGNCTRILFIGNSYIYTNDLPGMFIKLVSAGGHQVETGLAAQGGWTLAEHVNSTDTINQITSSKWDYIVLQEQSEIPAIEQSRIASMYPAARVLVNQIKGAGAKPIFFLTWAHKAGWPADGFQDYQSMQFQIDIGYLGIAQELSVPVAPVGYAWLLAMGQNSQLDLWQADGSHPTEQGTYLTACVFYSVIFRQSPEGLTYLAGLKKETATYLQKIAASTVLDNPAQWNLH
jgi:hypothetical protein